MHFINYLLYGVFIYQNVFCITILLQFGERPNDFTNTKGFLILKPVNKQSVAYLGTVCSSHQTGYLSAQLTGSSDGI